jgi:DDE family transposase
MIPLHHLLDLMPAHLLDRLAVPFQVNKVNQTKLPGQAVFLCLLNSLVNNPVVSQRILEATYQKVTGETVDHSSFGKRLTTINPAYFEALFTHVYRAIQPQMAVSDERALRLRRVDATTVVLSAKVMAFGIHVASGGKIGKEHAKRHVKSVFALSGEGLPEFLHLCTEQAEANDNPALGEAMIAATWPGELWIVDKGLFDRDRLLSIHQRGGFFLVPHKDQALHPLGIVWEASAAQRAEWSAAPPPASPRGGKGRAPAPCRLLRVEQAVFRNSVDAKSPAKQEKWGQLSLLVLYCERWDERKQKWQPLVLLTNLELSADGTQAGPYTLAEVAELYRLRWEIELFFKFLKQHLSFDHLTSHSENGIRVMIWMALIAAVLLIWYKRATGRKDYWNVIRFWFAEEVRLWTQAQLEADLARVWRSAGSKASE